MVYVLPDIYSTVAARSTLRLLKESTGNAQGINKAVGLMKKMGESVLHFGNDYLSQDAEDACKSFLRDVKAIGPVTGILKTFHVTDKVAGAWRRVWYKNIHLYSEWVDCALGNLKNAVVTWKLVRLGVASVDGLTKLCAISEVSKKIIDIGVEGYKWSKARARRNLANRFLTEIQALPEGRREEHSAAREQCDLAIKYGDKMMDIRVKRGFKHLASLVLIGAAASVAAFALSYFGFSAVAVATATTLILDLAFSLIDNSTNFQKTALDIKRAHRPAPAAAE